MKPSTPSSSSCPTPPALPTRWMCWGTPWQTATASHWRRWRGPERGWDPGARYPPGDDRNRRNSPSSSEIWQMGPKNRSWLLYGGSPNERGIDVLTARGIPNYPFPRKGSECLPGYVRIPPGTVPARARIRQFTKSIKDTVQSLFEKVSAEERNTIGDSRLRTS
jgi:hypothetical protein